MRSAKKDAAICDLCLLEGSHDLGMVLAAVAVTRAYASMGGTPEERQAALEELGAFARVYERVAAKSWPAGIIRIIPDFASGNDTTPGTDARRQRPKEVHRCSVR